MEWNQVPQASTDSRGAYSRIRGNFFHPEKRARKGRNPEPEFRLQNPPTGLRHGMTPSVMNPNPEVGGIVRWNPTADCADFSDF
jgi:hypothetical protein